MVIYIISGQDIVSTNNRARLFDPLRFYHRWCEQMRLTTGKE